MKQLPLLPRRATCPERFKPYQSPVYGPADCEACGAPFQARIAYAGGGPPVTRCAACDPPLVTWQDADGTRHVVSAAAEPDGLERWEEAFPGPHRLPLTASLDGGALPLATGPRPLR